MSDKPDLLPIREACENRPNLSSMRTVGIEALATNYRIPMSPHLHAGAPKMTAVDLIALKGIRALGLQKGIQDIEKSHLLTNLATVSDEQIHALARHFGESGVFKLNFLAIALRPNDFKHFFDYISDDMIFRDVFHDMTQNTAEIALETDNSWLKATSELDNFCHNVINSSFSRKLYNPGVSDGFVVHGLGGPRILVSLPFRGATKFGYDVFNNSVDVVTSLRMRGYLGTYLLLDSVEGLNQEIVGQPAWLLWFSIIASHSDLVIFVKESSRDLSYSQEREAAFTPDRVSKKVVELNPGELSWAKMEDDDLDSDTPIMTIIPGKGLVAQEDWEADQLRRMAVPFIQAYERGSVPRDRLIVLHEDGSLTEYPLEERLGTASTLLRHIPFESDPNPSNAGRPLPEPSQKRRRWWPFR